MGNFLTTEQQTNIKELKIAQADVEKQSKALSDAIEHQKDVLKRIEEKGASQSNPKQDNETWFQDRIHRLEQESTEWRIKNTGLRAENGKLIDQITQLHDERQILNAHCDALRRENWNQKERYERERKQWGTDKTKLQKQCDELQDENRSVKRQKTHMENENRKLHAQIDELQRETWRRQEECAALQARVQILERPPRKAVRLLLYCPIKQSLADTVIPELSRLLQTHLHSTTLDLLVEQRDNLEGAEDPRCPVLVVCVNASRLGTDVSHALQGVNRSKEVTVIVLHHQESHVVPCQPSERLLTGPEYKQLYAIVDMAFLVGKGIYSCDMNDKATEKLVHFVKSFES